MARHFQYKTTAYEGGHRVGIDLYKLRSDLEKYIMCNLTMDIMFLCTEFSSYVWF